MPKKSGKGGKRHRKFKKGDNSNRDHIDIDKNEGIIYAKVDKLPGGHFLDVICSDGVKRKCRISGRCRNRRDKRCKTDDLIVVSLRTDIISERNVCDMLDKPDQTYAKRQLSNEEYQMLFLKNTSKTTYQDEEFDPFEEYNRRVEEQQKSTKTKTVTIAKEPDLESPKTKNKFLIVNANGNADNELDDEDLDEFDIDAI